MAKEKFSKRPTRDELPMRRRYKQVNVWKSTFGPIAVVAVFDVYAQAFNITFKEARKLQFTHCLELLRKLEDPSYISWRDRK